jgi:carbon storage regulator
MLVLSRKKGESVMIGDIRVIVNKIHGDRVSLAIDAPVEIPIVRMEIRNTEGGNAKQA